MAIQSKPRIEFNPKIMAGKPVIRGTRLTVDFVLELLAHGWTYPQIFKNYPQLKEEDIQAVLEYSADSIKREFVYPLA